MGSGAIKWHVHCSVCGAFIEKSAQSDSEVECKKCRSTLEIFVKDDMVSVRPIHIRDEQLKSRMRTYSRRNLPLSMQVRISRQSLMILPLIISQPSLNLPNPV